MPAPGELLAAAAELLAWSDSIDAARAAGLAIGSAQQYAAESVTREREAQARAEGYAEAIAEMQRAERGIVGEWRRLAEAEAGRWIVRGEVRQRSTFGAPHPADYLGGPVSWPELPDDRQLAAPEVTAAIVPTSAAGNSRAEVAA